MIRRVLVAAAVPFALFACAEPAAPEGVASDDITAIDDLPPLEANLGLVKDPNRTRSNAVLEAGPCYRKMTATGRAWNLRRYTKGAAFFFTKADGDPLDPIACVDLDVVHNGQPATMSLSDLSLDIVQRFSLGRFNASASMPRTTSAGPAMFAFQNGSIELAVLGPPGQLTAKENMASYDGAFAGVIRGFSLQSFPAIPVFPVIRDFIPAAANLVYRYAKHDPGLPIAQDPIGRFVSIEDTNPEGAGDQFGWKVQFENATVQYDTTELGDYKREWLTLFDRATGRKLAACAKVHDGLERDFSCAVEPSHGTWEIPWGTDLH